MPKIDKSIWKGLDGPNFVHAERVFGERKLEVTVLTDSVIFERYVRAIYGSYEAIWGAVHPGAPLPISDDVFVQYAYTAMRCRLARVNNERFHTRCDDPEWRLPAQLAVPINAVGKVTVEDPILTVIPVWDKKNDARILTREQFEVASRQLRALERTPYAKFVFVRALAGDRSGDEVLMFLIPVRDAQGRIIEIHARKGYELDGIAATTYLICGLEPEAAEGLALNDIHPLLLPNSFVRVSGVLHYLDRIADIGAA